jgi:hypothetical protein
MQTILGYNSVKSGARLFLFLKLRDDTLLFYFCHSMLLLCCFCHSSLLPVFLQLRVAAHISATLLCEGSIFLSISVSEDMPNNLSDKLRSGSPLNSLPSKIRDQTLTSGLLVISNLLPYGSTNNTLLTKKMHPQHPTNQFTRSHFKLGEAQICTGVPWNCRKHTTK